MYLIGGPCYYRCLSFAATHHSIAYREIVDCTVTLRRGATDSIRRVCRYARFVIGREASTFICIVPFDRDVRLCIRC